MKKIFAVAMLVSLATAAFADGPFLPPARTTTNTQKLRVAAPADGPFLPPTTGEPTKP
jgi:hypothetical protein